MHFVGQVDINGTVVDIQGTGNGPLSSFIDGIGTHFSKAIHVTNYSEHAISQNHLDDGNNSDENKTNADAVAYIQLSVDGQIYSGIGTCTSTVSAMLKGALSALTQITQ